jgi:hypothetical protein
LQAKFLSSIHHRKTNNQSAPTVQPTPNTSASTPLAPKPKQQAVVAPPTPTPTSTNQQNGGTRRKTLSLLVNSMTDNKIPFTNRRASKSPAATVKEQAAHMMPSVSEHTINTLYTNDDKEKHRSAGKKLMDWFKKKPLSK